MFLSLYSALAQAESLSVSENCKWRIRKSYENGENICLRFCFGYCIKKGKVTIDEEQAQVVREIFNSYLNGVSCKNIAKSLNDRQIPKLFGGQWNYNGVYKVLRNIFYTGDALLQKRYVNNHIEKCIVSNHGEKDMFFVENSHPAIIDKEVFSEVQKKLKESNNEHKTKGKKTYPFTGKLVCERCGKNYKRRASRYADKWVCSTYYNEGKEACPSKMIREDVLIETTAAVLNLTEFDAGVFAEKVSRITVCNDNRLIYRFKDGKKKEMKMKARDKGNAASSNHSGN